MHWLLLALMVSLSGCASAPSKAQYRQLLRECREHHRENIRIIKEYEKRLPLVDQTFDGTASDIGGM